MKKYIIATVMTGLLIASTTLAMANINISGWDEATQTTMQNNVSLALEKNPNVTSASITKESVSLNYKAPTKLFGFIKTSMNIRLWTNEKGQVNVTFPWYKFMVTSEFSHISEEINGVFVQNKTALDFLNINGNADLQTKLVINISDVLRAKEALLTY